MAKIDDAMYKIPGFPGYMGDAPKTEEDYESLQWLGEWTPSKPTWVQVQEQLTLILKEDVKVEAKKRIAAVDWSVLADVQISNQADFIAYRALLRGIISDPQLNQQYPTEPQPVWI
jgi:hypothetical protein